MRHWIATAAPIFLLGACMMGPDYMRPETPSGDEWRIAPATAESVANLAWWELLKDRELQELMRVALQENLDVRIAAASVEQYQAQLVIANFDLAPSLSYSGTAFTYYNTSNVLALPGGGFLPGPSTNTGGFDLNVINGGAGVKWEADLWGRVRRSIEATKAQLLSRAENQRAVILGLISNVAEAYFDLRTLDLQVDITKRTLKAWDEAVRLSQARFNQGYIPKLDLDRFEAEQANTAATLADLERQVVQKENQISALLGHRPMAIARGLALTEQPMPPDVPPGLPSDLLQRRPDLLQAEQELAAATAHIGVAQAARFPQLSLTGGAGAAAVDATTIASTGPFGMFNAAAALSGPLLNATALGYQVDVSEAQTREALAKYQRAVITAFKEVEDALIAVQKSREQRTAVEKQVAALQSAFHFADLRYQGGRASYLDVLSAQRNLFDAELSLARSRRAQLVSVVQLYKALGGGWSPSGPEYALSQSEDGSDGKASGKGE
jgi:multidrug efflux system outer membrane protein